PMFAAGSSIVFAVLLFSAVNTALADLVSIQFMLARDKELPHAFGGLNRYGMPVLPLIIGTVVPAIVVLIFPDVEALAGLYAIGVVGAISINLGTTSTNPALPLRRGERVFMLGLTAVMIVVGVTICIVKPHARSFALLVLVSGLSARLATIVANRKVEMPRTVRISYLTLAAVAVVIELGVDLVLGNTLLAFAVSMTVAVIVGYASHHTQGYRLALIAAEHAQIAEAPTRPMMIQPGGYTPKLRIMIATQGNPRLIDFALKTCKSREAELQLLFIRHLAVTPMGTTTAHSLAEDDSALALFDQVQARAKHDGVPLRLLYGVARDVPDAILDMAVTHGADQLLLGTTKRGALWKVMKGDVIQAVAEHLPEGIDLLIHA
ncbi:MAG: universal stress protein, partial [Isosphaeraceae bacterium]